MPDVPRHPRRLAFLGTPQVAADTLRTLVEADVDIAVVVSRGDKRRSRSGGTEPSPVKAAALELGLPVTTRVDDVLDAGVDLGVVVAFGQLIKPHVLDVVPMVNLHFSLLPRWRGAAPVERAILAGDDETGVCLMQLEEGLDTGPVFACRRVPIDEAITAHDLRSLLGELGVQMLLHRLEDGFGAPTPQVGEPTYAAKIDAAELAIDWHARAIDIARLTRVGKAWTTFRGRRLLVVSAQVAPTPPAGPPGTLDGVTVATGDGGLCLEVVQPEGRRSIDARAWRNGVHPVVGERLGT